MNFLHQKCTHRLRSLGQASAKYSLRGEPVTFLVVMRAFGALQHHRETLVKPGTKRAREPVFTRFSHTQALQPKITAPILRFVHACCIRNRMDYKRTIGIGRRHPIKTVAGLPDGDSSVLPGTLFYRCKKAPKQRESCQSGCIGTVNLRHPALLLRQRRKEAERLISQVSPTMSA